MKYIKSKEKFCSLKGKNYILVVEYGLQKIGEQKPYFFITGDLYIATKKGEKDRRYKYAVACGCLHDIILKVFPELAEMVNFHLRDIDGAPMYPIENGWYYYTHGEFEILKKHLRDDIEIDDYNFKDKEEFTNYIDSLRPQWKKDADNLIKKFSLDKE